MKLRIRSLVSLLLGIILTSGGSASAMHDDPDEGNSRMSLDGLTGEESLLRVKPKITVEVPVGEDTELQCRSETGQALVQWWQTPFGSFGDRKLSNNDPIGINNGTLKILKATRSHSGFYNCHIVDSRGTTVIPYRVNAVGKNMDKRSLRVTREDETNTGYDLAPAVVPSVLVTFVVAFTLGAFSRPYVMKCLQKTRCSKGLFRMPTNTKSSWFKDSAASKSSTPFKSPTKLFWSKNQPEEVRVEGADQLEDGADGAESRREEEETHIKPKRRSRVIKVYNYDEEGKRYDHVTELEVAVEEHESGTRQRVMSLTRLNAIMSQVQTPDFSTNRRSTQNSLDTPGSPSQS